MSSAMRSGGVSDEAAAGAAELVVEHDGGGECGEASAEADAEVSQGARAVAFQGEDVLEGPEDRLDPLADRREMRLVCVVVGAGGLRRDQRCGPERRGGRGCVG